MDKSRPGVQAALQRRCVGTRYLLSKQFYATRLTVLITPAYLMNSLWSVSMKWQSSLNYILILYVDGISTV